MNNFKQKLVKLLTDMFVWQIWKACLTVGHSYCINTTLVIIFIFLHLVSISWYMSILEKYLVLVISIMTLFLNILLSAKLENRSCAKLTWEELSGGSDCFGKYSFYGSVISEWLSNYFCESFLAKKQNKTLFIHVELYPDLWTNFPFLHVQLT